MDFFQHRYYKINKILLSLIGQWPYQTTRERRKVFAVGVLIAIVHTVSTITAVVKYHDDEGILLKSASPLIFAVMSYTKVFFCMWNSQKMLKLVNRIRTDWQIWAQDREVNILHHYAGQGRKMTIEYAVMICVNGILFITQPVISKITDILLNNGSKPSEFPIPVYYYHLDLEKYYFYVIMYSCVCACLGMVVTVAVDATFMVYVQHNCGIFAALGSKLERIGQNQRASERGETAYALNNRDMDFENLVSCVNRHNDAIEFAELIEATYSWCFFFIVAYNMIMISTTGLQIIKKDNDPQEIIKFMVWLVAHIVHLYIESYMSQRLMDHSIRIRYNIHNCKWYSLSPKAQKLVPSMLMRCDVPCRLTAGNITIMSLETFIVFLKTSMSYFTLLHSM